MEIFSGLSLKFPRRIFLALLVAAGIPSALRSTPQSGTLAVQPTANVQTIAGTGKTGYSGDGGAAPAATLAGPAAMTADAAGNVYVAERDNHIVRKIDTLGNISTFAGTGIEGFGGDGGPATAAFLDSPAGVTVDSAGNLYVADTHNHRIRKISGGVITTIAGNGVQDYCGDGGPALAARLHSPRGLTFDANGNLYIADSENERVRVISGGIISTFAGTGVQGMLGDGGPATSAQLNTPAGVSIDTAGNIYISDSNSNRIRVVSTAGIISGLAGSGGLGYSGDGGPAMAATLADPESVRQDPFGHFLIADSNNNEVREISSGTITSVAGIDLEGSNAGSQTPATAMFDQPKDTWPQVTGFFLADYNNERVRRVDFASLDFGNQGAGVPSATLPITLGNSGTTPATVTSVQLSGAAFSVSPAGNCPLTLPFTITAGTSCIIAIVFDPAALGVFGETATIADTAAGSPQTVILAGVGILNSTSVVLTAQPAAIVYGDPVTLTAQIQSPATGGAAFTGTVALEDGATLIATQPVNVGAAQFPLPLETAGIHSFTANYSGDANYSPGSGTLTLAVAKATPTISLMSVPSPITPGFPLTLSASVQSPASTPTGSVEFFDGATLLGSVSLDGAGGASFNIANLSASSHSFTAVYTGDSNFISVTSQPIDAQGAGAFFTLSSENGKSHGFEAEIPIDVTPENGFNSSVMLTCSGLPADSSCAFSPSLVNVDGKAVSSLLVIETETHCQQPGAPHSLTASLFDVPPLLLIAILFVRRKRTAAGILLVLFVAVHLGGCVGCAGVPVGDCHTPPGNYVITITGTSTVGSTVTSATTVIDIVVTPDGSIVNSNPVTQDRH
jgi:hypothetical protein